MWRWWLVQLVWLWTAVAAPRIGLAQADVPPPASVTDALHSMSDRAGVIFVGTVTAIRRVDGDGHSSGVVEVTFSVDQVVRGCTSATYTLREWGGLWTSSTPRYTVGEQRLMLLNAPAPGGLSSPLNGMDGAIPIHGVGQAVGPASSTTGTTAASADLRWVEAGEVTRLPFAANVPVVTAKPLRGVTKVQGSVTTASAGSAATVAAPAVSAAPAAVASVQVATLIRQIAGWEASRAR